ncbi:WD40 repeat domain-containing protein [Gemmata sp. JC673]|uniref:WD40 repeat domain-containing protein n=1 Tax=Gemmata algarum TaxID=2975278 RepID=A0ABU5F8M4_9BACT|nr:WD40 repeat domain-containing protein [Gemmata algarum]MDY3562211.1 WD40 repeat domain-containing protein [Gemmata algarum]
MQVLKLATEQPEAGTDVTRLWLGPGLARIAVVFGNGVPFNGSVLCWDASAGRALWRAPLQDDDDTYADPDFDRDVTRCAYTVAPDRDDTDDASEGGVAVCDLATGAAVRLGSDHTALPALTSDGRSALAVEFDMRNRRGVRRWEVPVPLASTDTPLAPVSRWRIDLPVPTDLARHTDETPQALAVSPDGARIALGRTGGSVTVWERSNRREVLSVPALKGMKYVRFGVHRLAFSDDGNRLAAVRGRWADKRYGFQVHVWSLSDGTQLRGPKETANVNGVAFSPDGRTLLTAREDGTVGEWDTATWKLRREMAWKIGKLFSVAFAPDGLTCAAGGEKGRVVVWDVDV